eukprot:15352746-Alexandrium_andersonii.AAC.1
MRTGIAWAPGPVLAHVSGGAEVEKLPGGGATAGPDPLHARPVRRTIRAAPRCQPVAARPTFVAARLVLV